MYKIDKMSIYIYNHKSKTMYLFLDTVLLRFLLINILQVSTVKASENFPDVPALFKSRRNQEFPRRSAKGNAQRKQIRTTGSVPIVNYAHWGSFQVVKPNSKGKQNATRKVTKITRLALQSKEISIVVCPDVEPLHSKQLVGSDRQRCFKTKGRNNRVNALIFEVLCLWNALF